MAQQKSNTWAKTSKGGRSSLVARFMNEFENPRSTEWSAEMDRAAGRETIVVKGKKPRKSRGKFDIQQRKTLSTGSN